MIQKILSRPIKGLSLLVLLLCSVTVSADAIIRSQAMFASTVAEIFIEKQQVRVELEIGGQDLKAFANLLPDAIYEEMLGTPRPLTERLEEFFSQQLVLTVEGSEKLHGALVKIGPSKRQRRDPVTGEVLAADNEENVVMATLVYPFTGNPEFMVIQQNLRGSSIGFVAYHGSVPINDFRYLSPAQVVDLDWQDPWYSTFRSRALRRTYSHPMSGFLYVEPYEVRKEIIVRPKDLQFWLDLGFCCSSIGSPAMGSWPWIMASRAASSSRSVRSSFLVRSAWMPRGLLKYSSSSWIQPMRLRVFFCISRQERMFAPLSLVDCQRERRKRRFAGRRARTDALEEDDEEVFLAYFWRIRASVVISLLRLPPQAASVRSNRTTPFRMKKASIPPKHESLPFMPDEVKDSGAPVPP